MSASSICNSAEEQIRQDELHAQKRYLQSQISAEKINELELVWQFRSGVVRSYDTVQASPLYHKGLVYTVDLSGNVIALRAESGSEVWRRKLGSPAGRRGIVAQPSLKTTQNSNLFVSTKQGVTQLDAADGKIIREFKSGTSIVSPLVVDQSLYIGTLNEGVKAYNIETGKALWTRPLAKGGVTPRIWSGLSIDRSLGLIFVNTSNPDSIVGVGRSGDDFSSSVIAIDLATGDIRWQHKHIENDLWDYDVVGTPIILNHVSIEGRQYESVVISLSKTGDIITLDAKTGAPVYSDQIKKIVVPMSDAPGVRASTFQNKYHRPTNLADIGLNPTVDLRADDGKLSEYLKTKLRNAAFGPFLPPSTNYDAVIFGLHGGAEWPGGAIHFENKTPHLIVPTNRYPWILRIFYEDPDFNSLLKTVQRLRPVTNFFAMISEKFNRLINWLFGTSYTSQTEANTSDSLTRWDTKNWFYAGRDIELANAIYPSLPWTPTHPDYQSKCAVCHGSARQGNFQSELHGDGFYPPLVALHRSQKWIQVNTVEKAKKIHNVFGVNIQIDEAEYQSIMSYYAEHDDKRMAKNELSLKGFWQLLLDADKKPASKEPWGNIASTNLSTGDRDWQVPLGGRLPHEDNGDLNFGGVLSLDTGIVFATGTPRPSLYALDVKTGKKIWEGTLPFSGSAPPVSFNHQGCDMIVVSATGGRFLGFEKNGDATVAFKLRACTFQK